MGGGGEEASGECDRISAVKETSVFGGRLLIFWFSQLINLFFFSSIE
jgi:hypothetical protein